MYHKTQTNEIVKAGYLTKSPPDGAPPMSQWRRRWFVLRDSLRSYPLAERFVRLEYYQNESEARKLSDPKGVINLTNCNRVSGSAPVKGHKFVLDICTKERMYHLAAETPSEKYEWMETLNDLLFSNASPHQVSQCHDLEEKELEIRRTKQQAGRQSSLEMELLMIKQQNVGRPQSYHEGSSSPVPGRGGLNKNRPLPPTPGQKERPSSNVSLPPIPKPRSKPEVQTHSTSSAAVPITTDDYSEIPEDDTSIPSGQPSDYEVPVKSLSHGRNSISAPALSTDYEELPPTPPPRRRGQPPIEESPTYESNDSYCISESRESNDEGSYGVLMKISPMVERRCTDPEIISVTPTSSTSPTTSSLSADFFATKSPTGFRDQRPSPSPRTKRKYYENTGFVPEVTVLSDGSDYSHLSFNVQKLS